MLDDRPTHSIHRSPCHAHRSLAMGLQNPFCFTVCVPYANLYCRSSRFRITLVAHPIRPPQRSKGFASPLAQAYEGEGYVECDAGLEETMMYIKQTNDEEKKVQSGTRYVDCFKGVDRRRIEIMCICWIIQALCGGTFMGFST